MWKNAKQDLLNAPEHSFNPRKDYPQIFAFHSSVWANLYESNFIKNMKFVESSRCYQDMPFAMECLAKVTTMAVVKEPLYHYRMEPNQNNSTQASPKKLIGMANMTLMSVQILARENVLDGLKEYFFYHAAMANMGFFDKQSLKGRRIYAQKMYEVFALYKNPQFTHFKPKLKVWTQTIMQGKVPKLSFKDLRRRVLRLRFRKDEIHIKLGNFEIKKSFKNG